MNKLTIIGNVTKDTSLAMTQSGTSVCRFTVAVNGRKKNDGTRDTDFFSVTAFRGLADICSKYVHKGSKVCVVGAVSQHTYQANDGTTRANLDVIADEVELLDRRGDAYDQTEVQNATANSGFTAVETDDLPF